MDPIADFLTIIRNGYLAKLLKVSSSSSKAKKEVAQILKEKGYIEDFTEKSIDNKKIIEVVLKYTQGQPAITHVKRLSKPGLRVYQKSKNLKSPLSGLGLLVVSTSRGVMSNNEARRKHLGGELICEVW